MSNFNRLTRRQLLVGAVAIALPRATAAASARIIDIHQHTSYRGRTHRQLVEHQRKLGAARTVLLPAGRYLGLEAGVGGNEEAYQLVKQFPRDFVFFANEVPFLADALRVIERYLKLGARGIGEQKFPIPCDSPYILELARLAADYQVPILMHFEYGAYNTGYERFHRVLEQCPGTNFIGHAQTFWAHIDKNCNPRIMYPQGPVTPGGLTDRYLTDYPNLYADLSANSALNALRRDLEHARQFVIKHQDRLLFGSDCPDTNACSNDCIGCKMLETLRGLNLSQQVLDKILYKNAQRLLKLDQI